MCDVVHRTMFDVIHQTQKSLQNDVQQNIFDKLQGVWKCDETLSCVFETKKIKL